MKKVLTILGIVIFLCGCGTKKPGSPEKTTTKIPEYIKVSKDYIEIDFPTNESPTPYSVSIDSTLIKLPGFTIESKPLFSLQDSNLLIATSKSSKAYVINLISMKRIKEYRMRQVIDQVKNPDGPPCNCTLNLTMDLEGLDFYTNDNIILQINLKLLVINSSGNIVDSIPLKENKFVYANLYETPVDYNPLTNKIYVYKYCFDCKPGSPEYYSHSFEASIDPGSKKITDENLKYPEIYSLFGITAMEHMNRTSYENFQFCTFFPDHRIYKYNTLNQQTSVYGGKSTHSTGKIWTTSKLETNYDNMLEKMNYTDLYFQVVYDNINDRYYRLFIHPDTNNPNMDYPKFEYYVQIFNQKFCLQDEIKFDKFGSFYFSFGGKLYWVALRQEGVMLYGYTFH